MTQLAKPHLCYMLFCANRYGTERMALATLEALRDDFEVSVLSPPGELEQLTREASISHHLFRNTRELAGIIWRLVARHPRLGFISTTVKASALFALLARLRRRDLVHLHVVHGSGTDSAFRNKRWLNRLPLTIFAVSGWVRDQLISYGVKPTKVMVAPNFLSASQLAQLPFTEPRPQVSRGIAVGRVDPFKRLDLLLDALEQMPPLRSLLVDVYGGGFLNDEYQRRADQHQLPIQFHGFYADVPARLREADLFIHTCPTEAAPIVVLEAMAIGIPVVLPDSGGAQEFIEPGASGFIYRAGDAQALGEAILAVRSMSSSDRRRIAAAARDRVDRLYSANAGIDVYRRSLARLT